MALVDVDGTATGVAVVDGSIAILTAISETLSGGGSAGSPVTINHEIVETLVGAGSASASSQTIFNVSGFVVGSGALIDARLLDAAGTTSGVAVVFGNLARYIDIAGLAIGGSSISLSVPETILGAALVTAYLEVIHVPLPICQTPQISSSFRWGHTFTRGDLDICLVDADNNPFKPVCVSYTLYQVVRGCVLKQVGASHRKPASSGLGCYYVTGTAGECGQPGLWAVRWHWQKTFGASAVDKDCYFQVLDAVLGPIPGDTLQRNCKYGWD